MALSGDLDLEERRVGALEFQAHDRPGGGRVPQRGPEAPSPFVGAGDLEVVGSGEALGFPLLGVRVVGVVEGEGAELRAAVLDPAVEDVDVAHEADDEGRRGLLEDLGGAAHLLDPALVHHDDAVGDLERLLLVVRHEDAREPDLVVEAPQPAPQLLAHLRVEGAEGLVEEEDPRLDGEGAGEGHALPLAPGELGRQAVGEPVELDELEELRHLLPDLRLARPGGPRPHAQPEGDVLEDAHVTEERVVLEDEADAAPAHVLPRLVLSLEEDLPGVGPLEAGDDPQEARLARARRAEEGHELPRRDVEAHVVHGDEVAEPLGDATDLDAHAASPARRTRSSAPAGPSSAAAPRLDRHSTRLLATRVTRARKVRSEATAKAAWNWYSL